ncbi:DUF2283 domain-containing protein [bacterium]|nr:DUF2283 domain-containing protein [bacterium]
MIFEYDSQADAAYVKISDNEIADTREVAEGIIVDFNSDGKVVGIEILSMKSRSSKTWDTRSKQVVLQS